MKYGRGGVDGLDETSTGRVNRCFIIKQKIIIISEKKVDNL